MHSKKKKIPLSSSMRGSVLLLSPPSLPVSASAHPSDVLVNGTEIVQFPSPPLTTKRRKPLAVPIRVVSIVRTPNGGVEIAAIA
jgi:hypothetical protein